MHAFSVWIIQTSTLIPSFSILHKNPAKHAKMNRTVLQEGRPAMLHQTGNVKKQSAIHWHSFGSGWWESNPPPKLGKLVFYRWTTAAYLHYSRLPDKIKMVLEKVARQAQARQSRSPAHNLPSLTYSLLKVSPQLADTHWRLRGCQDRFTAEITHWLTGSPDERCVQNLTG